MNLYFVTRTAANMEEIMNRLNFEIVLLGRGHFSSKTCIWMGWQPKEGDSNEKLFQKLNGRFDLESMGISPIQSILFPENLVWENAYRDILVFGTPEELKVYIERFSVFSENSMSELCGCADGFIYKMECNVEESIDGEGKVRRNLTIIDRGFLYESTRE